MNPDSEFFPFVVTIGFLVTAATSVRLGTIIGRQLRLGRLDETIAGRHGESGESNQYTLASLLSHLEDNLRSRVDVMEATLGSRLEHRLARVEETLSAATAAHAAATAELSNSVARLASATASLSQVAAVESEEGEALLSPLLVPRGSMRLLDPLAPTRGGWSLSGGLSFGGEMGSLLPSRVRRDLIELLRTDPGELELWQVALLSSAFATAGQIGEPTRRDIAEHLMQAAERVLYKR